MRRVALWAFIGAVVLAWNVGIRENEMSVFLEKSAVVSFARARMKPADPPALFVMAGVDWSPRNLSRSTRRWSHFDAREATIPEEGSAEEKVLISSLEKELSKRAPNPVSVDLGYRKTPRYIIGNAYRGKITGPQKGTPFEIAMRFLTENASLFKTSEAYLSEMKEDDTERFRDELLDQFGVRFPAQKKNGLQIFDSMFQLMINRDGSVYSYQGNIAPDQSSSTYPIISQDLAFERIRIYWEPEKDEKRRAILNALQFQMRKRAHWELKLILFPLKDSLRIAWEEGSAYDSTVVDANTGEILFAQRSNPVSCGIDTCPYDEY